MKKKRFDDEFGRDEVSFTSFDSKKLQCIINSIYVADKPEVLDLV